MGEKRKLINELIQLAARQQVPEKRLSTKASSSTGRMRYRWYHCSDSSRAGGRRDSDNGSRAGSSIYHHSTLDSEGIIGLQRAKKISIFRLGMKFELVGILRKRL